MNIKQVLIGATIAASALAANAAQTVGLNNVPGNPNAWTFFGAVPDLADTTFTFDPVDTLSGQYDTLLTFGFGGFGFGATSFTVTLDGTPLSYDSNSGSFPTRRSSDLTQAPTRSKAFWMINCMASNCNPPATHLVLLRPPSP